MINKLTPSLLYQPIIQSILEFQGDLFKKYRDCPYCHSSNCKKHAILEKLFCKVIINAKFQKVSVYIQYYYCNECHKTYMAESPFYERIMYCQPIVDLCLYFSAKSPHHRVERLLLEHGIQLDRDTVRNYNHHFEDKVKKYAGLKILDELAGVNLLKLMFNVDNVSELRKKYPHEKYDGVADETYPAIKGAKKKFKEINKERKLEGKDPFKYPAGFTVAVSYLAALQFYASLVLNEVAFSQVFSRILLLPLLGVDFFTTDGHGAYNIYNDIMEHLRCILHRCKNLSKKDKILKRMKKEKKPPDEIKKYLSSKYKELEKEELEKLKTKFPSYFDDKGNFEGALTSNAIEGGNWRIKNEMRTSYGACNSITARTILICLMDSIFTFRQGVPVESFAHQHTSFSFEKVMRQ
jgi:hypothetical protein